MTGCRQCTSANAGRYRPPISLHASHNSEPRSPDITCEPWKILCPFAHPKGGHGDLSRAGRGVWRRSPRGARRHPGTNLGTHERNVSCRLVCCVEGASRFYLTLSERGFQFGLRWLCAFPSVVETTPSISESRRSGGIRKRGKRTAGFATKRAQRASRCYGVGGELRVTHAAMPRVVANHVADGTSISCQIVQSQRGGLATLGQLSQSLALYAFSDTATQSWRSKSLPSVVSRQG